ncbi:2-keto-4-pentenoate hydratase [Priestia taiwanensis]|uniref:2-keto-4-pentenoate hydratase n=1 Tax=Priestia taiwanensis TaxID=1347902 RepID=A0A917ALP0_9BACI|nr:fumarylacetoacetate hydrolase family protein [Priestia taiwanensis]MBM7362269.1 2-oxo-3-hexenedioate decarboxylase [Priestia taiwanensis]GGE60847.1 2-keto-4-pentenoate hydratase [Priestia taiwanensis]
MRLAQGIDKEIVDTLLYAQKEGKTITKFTDQYPELTINGAYDIQHQLIETYMRTGVKRIGVKLGLTSKAKQKMIGINEAIYGYLLHNMLAYEWEPIDGRKLIHPKAEPEIAFIMGEDLQGTTITAKDVLHVTAYVAPAIEIIDSRYENFRFLLPDVIADNCSSSAFILGSKWIKPSALKIEQEGVVMTKNGEVQTVGAGAAVLNHPAEAVAWAVNKLGERNDGLKKGEIVLSGALTEAIAFGHRDTVIAQFSSLGSISFHCK